MWHETEKGTTINKKELRGPKRLLRNRPPYGEKDLKLSLDTKKEMVRK